MSFIDSFGRELVVKPGETAPAQTTLEKAGLIGIYFSAHWCPPCKGFTPVLAEFYNDCKEHNLGLEIVFVSSDRDQSSFDEYHREMPWPALPFTQSAIKQMFAGKYGVKGIPMLIIFKPDGTVVDADGRGAVMRAKGDVDKCIAAWKEGQGAPLEGGSNKCVIA